jgi:hypothetical protein
MGGALLRQMENFGLFFKNAAFWHAQETGISM